MHEIKKAQNVSDRKDPKPAQDSSILGMWGLELNVVTNTCLEMLRDIMEERPWYRISPR
jgi:hypothetical protein